MQFAIFAELMLQYCSGDIKLVFKYCTLSRCRDRRSQQGWPGGLTEYWPPPSPRQTGTETRWATVCDGGTSPVC